MALIDALLKQMVARGASDLHLREGRTPKARVNGAIAEISPEALGRDAIYRMLAEAAGDERWEAFARRRDLDFAYQMDEASRFRANYFVQATGVGAVFRLIPVKVRTLDELGAPPAMKSFADLRAGLVLVTGPTGSGKSTTMAALIDQINASHGKHIVTIEEPIEFIHRNKKSVVTQREVPDNAPSFHAGLKAAVREDADVILIGEMRDLETIAAALTAAETGVLVIGTLHTNSARKTVDRIVDVFPASQQAQIRTMLGASLKGVVCQSLLKSADGKGRVAAHEVLVGTLAVASIIREGKTEKLTDVISASAPDGMKLLDAAIMDLLKAGRVTIFEAYMKANDKSKFEALLPKDNVLGVGSGLVQGRA